MQGAQYAPFGLTDEYLWNAEGGVPYKCYMSRIAGGGVPVGFFRNIVTNGRICGIMYVYTYVCGYYLIL